MRRSIYAFLLLLVYSYACNSPSNSSSSEQVLKSGVEKEEEPIIEEKIPKKEAIQLDYEQRDGYYVITWEDLSDVTFEEKYNDEYEAMVSYPVFSEGIHALNGKKIQIEGFIIPDTETQGNLHVLSGLPFSSCFFCGGAGPETVMDLNMKKAKKRFKTDSKMSFRGQLRLNDTDLYYLNYILENAEEVK